MFFISIHLLKEVKCKWTVYEKFPDNDTGDMRVAFFGELNK